MASDPAGLLAGIARLLSDRRCRDAERRFYAEGVRNFVQAVESGQDIETILASDRLLTAPLARMLMRRARRAGIPVALVTPEQFRRVCRAEHASGIGAVVSQRWTPLEAASPADGPFWLVLESIRSPGNLGTLLRTSHAAGGAGVILVGPEIDPFDPSVVRASMGSIFHQRLVRTDASGLRSWIGRHACATVGASPDGFVDLHAFPFPHPVLLVLGDERKGLSPEQRSICRHLVRIPMVPAADSLNVGVAGGLLMYEAIRPGS